MDFEAEINNSKTLKQIFEVCNKYYQTDSLLGIVSGAMVKTSIPKLVKTLNIKQR